MRSEGWLHARYGCTRRWCMIGICRFIARWRNCFCAGCMWLSGINKDDSLLESPLGGDIYVVNIRAFCFQFKGCLLNC